LLGNPDSPKSFAENMIKIMTDNQLRENLATNALETARSRNWDDIFDGLIATSAKLITNPRPQEQLLKSQAEKKVF